MAHPKKKISRANRDKRRAHDFITAPARSNCANCGGLIRPHHACASCGHYKGREVLVDINN